MSRIGKQPVAVPNGVQVSVQEGAVSVKGPKGALQRALASGVAVAHENGQLIVSKTGQDKQAAANYGSMRAHLKNMVTGVTEGWKRSLELSGVGFTAKLDGQVLTLAVGYSHEVKLLMPKELKCTVAKTTIDLEGADKDLVGQIASKIRKVCPPEPYLGKGIKYSTEKVRRKAGKTGKK